MPSGPPPPKGPAAIAGGAGAATAAAALLPPAAPEGGAPAARESTRCTVEESTTAAQIAEAGAGPSIRWRTRVAEAARHSSARDKVPLHIYLDVRAASSGTHQRPRACLHP